jgi:hypothetical protein
MKLSVIPGNADNNTLCYKTLSRNYVYITFHIEIHDKIINNRIMIYHIDVSAIWRRLYIK